MHLKLTGSVDALFYTNTNSQRRSWLGSNLTPNQRQNFHRFVKHDLGTFCNFDKNINYTFRTQNWISVDREGMEYFSVNALFGIRLPKNFLSNKAEWNISHLTQAVQWETGESVKFGRKWFLNRLHFCLTTDFVQTTEKSSVSAPKMGRKFCKNAHKI